MSTITVPENAGPGWYAIVWNTPPQVRQTGTNGRDTLIGGRDRNDYLDGGDGHDHLWGRNGYDTLIGGKGNDLLDGHNDTARPWGYDIYVFRPGDGFDSIHGFRLHERENGDLIRIYAANGADPRLRFDEYVYDDGYRTALIVYGDGGGTGGGDWGDHYYNKDRPTKNGGGTIQIDGMSLADLQASHLRFHIIGDERDNRLKGAWGDDVLEGGAGNDKIIGMGGNDQIFGGSGDDDLRGRRGDDFVHGGDGDDTLRGGKGNDTLQGGGGDDTFYGGVGNDTFKIWGGTNTLTGGEGEDRFYFMQASDASVNTITDFEDGVDVIAIRGQTLEDLAIVQEGENAVIRYDNVVITIEDMQASLLTAEDFDFIA